MIDWTKVEELKNDIGAEDFGEIVEVFLCEVEEELGQLAQKPLEERESSLHFLKGSALNLGFRDFSSLCHDGEKLSASGAPEGVEIDAIERCYAASKAVFLQGNVN